MDTSPRLDWIDALTDLKIATSFGIGRLASELIHSMLSGGGYRRHVEALRQRLARAMPQVRRQLEGLGIKPWADPGEGMYLWCRLPQGASAIKVARVALTHGVIFAPGTTFSLSEAGDAFFSFQRGRSAPINGSMKCCARRCGKAQPDAPALSR